MDLTLLHKSRNEIYSGRFEGHDDIFKYTNDKMEEPMILQRVGTPTLYATLEEVTSPSGSEYKLYMLSLIRLNIYARVRK